MMLLKRGIKFSSLVRCTSYCTLTIQLKDLRNGVGISPVAPMQTLGIQIAHCRSYSQHFKPNVCIFCRLGSLGKIVVFGCLGFRQ